jgi:ketosteroid isomerase-like protein
MSEENIGTLRFAFDAFNRGDVEGAFVHLAPDFEYISSGWLPDSEHSYRGRDKFRQFLGWLADEFEDARLEAREFIDAGDSVSDGRTVNLIVVSMATRGRGKDSGVEASWDFWHVWTFRDGQAVRGQGFMRREDALEAAGMREEAASERNVEIVRQAFAYEYYAIGDRSEAEAIFDPHVVMNPTDEAPSEGLDAMRADYERWASAWVDLKVTVEEIVHAGDQVVLVVHHQARGRKSGIEVDTRFYPVYTLREGKVSRVDEFEEMAEALEAAGLSD